MLDVKQINSLVTRYYQFLGSRGDVHPLFGHLAANKQTLVEEIRDAAAAHSVLHNIDSLYTVGLCGGLRLPKVDRGGDDPSESLHDHDVRRLLLQDVHQETKEQRERGVVGCHEQEIEEPIAIRTFQICRNVVSCFRTGEMTNTHTPLSFFFYFKLFNI